MGYTHYWKQDRDFTDEEWRLFALLVPKVAKLATAAGVAIDYEVNSQHRFISVNGIGGDSHEDCYITKAATDFAFCKTARKPYDSVVVALLCWAHQCCPAFTWTSDGDDEPDYANAGKALLELAA